MKIHQYNEMMRYLTRPKEDPSIKQLAKHIPQYGIQETYGAPEEIPMPNWRDLIREEGVKVGPQVKDGGRIGFKHGGSWADWMSNHSDQMTFEEYLQMDMNKPVHPIDKSAGGRVQYKPGGLVEPGVTHYGKYVRREGISALNFGKAQKVWTAQTLQSILTPSGKKEQSKSYKIIIQALEDAGITLESTPSKKDVERPSIRFENVTDATLKKFNKTATRLKADAGLPMSRFQTAELKKDIRTFVKNKVAAGEYVSRPVIMEEFGLAKKSGEALITRSLGKKVGPDTYEGGLLNKLGQAEKKAQSIKSAAAASAKTLTESDAVLKAINKEFIFDPDIPNSKEMAKRIYGSAFEKASFLEKADLVKQTDNDIMKYLKVLEGTRDMPEGMKLPSQNNINDLVDNILTNLEDPAGSTTKKGFRFSPGILRDYKYSIVDSLLNMKSGTFVGKRKKLIEGAGKELDEVFSVGATHRVAPGYAEAVQSIPKAANQAKKRLDWKLQKILSALDEGRTTMQWGKIKNVPIADAIKDFNKSSLKFANQYKVKAPKINIGGTLSKDFLANFGTESKKNIQDVLKNKNYFLSEVKNRPVDTLTSKTSSLIEKIGCPGLAAGGRASFKDGSTCYTRGMDKIQTGNITTAAEKLNFTKLAQTLGPDGWRFLGVDYDDPGRIGRLTSAMSKGVARLPTPGRVPLQFTGKLATGVGRFLADPFFVPLIPVELAVTGAYGFEKNKDEIMKSLKDNSFVSEMAKKYNMDVKDVRNAILEKYRRAVLNASAGTEEQMAFEPKHDEAVNKFDKEFYPFWESYEGKPHADTSFVKDPAFATGLGSAVLGMRQESEEEEYKLRSGEIGGTQFYKKQPFYTKKEYYPEDYKDKTLAGQIRSAERIPFENLRGLEDPLPEGGFYAGGRVPFVKGKLVDEGRRAFMKWLAGVTGAGLAAGTGLLKWGAKKGAGTTAIKAGDKIIQSTPGMPDWYIPLINRIVKEGDDVTKKLGTVEREIVHTKKIAPGEEVTVYQDLNTGNVRVAYGPPVMDKKGNVIRASNDPDVVQLEYRAPEVIEEGKHAGQKTNPEFSAAEAEPEVVNWDGDIEWSGVNEVNKVDDLVTDTNPLKQFATKKKPTMGEIVESSKKKKYQQKLQEDQMEQIDYIEKKRGPFPDPSDYAGGKDEMIEVFEKYRGEKASGGSVNYYDNYLPNLDDMDY